MAAPLEDVVANIHSGARFILMPRAGVGGGIARLAPPMAI